MNIERETACALIHALIKAEVEVMKWGTKKALCAETRAVERLFKALVSDAPTDDERLVMVRV